MAIKRSRWSNHILSIDGQKVKRGPFSGKVKNFGGKTVKRSAWRPEEISEVDGMKVERSFWTREVKDAPPDFYKIAYVENDDKRLVEEKWDRFLLKLELGAKLRGLK